MYLIYKIVQDGIVQREPEDIIGICKSKRRAFAIAAKEFMKSPAMNCDDPGELESFRNAEGYSDDDNVFVYVVSVKTLK